ncbi:het domain protein [Colletotrichum musicola]|uniref:Het domain protein n=1 Tax=Colletotrichum musicola TaxID=2175873 RepID=A0A8H6NEB1_9PEZI|nr:het domain protein [Colletotrichum musicola]
MSQVCGIDEPFLVGERPLAMASVAARMSWAAQRETTREEDRTYSLPGVFGVHIPLLYGEGGRNAFIRLQEELVWTSDDQTIFAWHWYGPYPEDDYNFPWLASSPNDFLGCHDVVVCNRIQLPSHFFMTNTGIRMVLPIVYDNQSNIRRTFAILECRRSTDYWNTFAVPVVIRGNRCIRADPSMVLFDRAYARSRSILFKLHLETRWSHRAPTQSLILPQKTAMLVLRSLPPGYRIHSVIPPTGRTAWSDTSGYLVHKPDIESPNACSVIATVADGSIDVPFEILCVIVKPRPGSGPNVTKHGAALVDPESFGLLSENDAGPQSHDFLGSSCQSVRSPG